MSKWTSWWCDVYFERFLSFRRRMWVFFFSSLFSFSLARLSYLWKDWENRFHYCHIYNQKLGHSIRFTRSKCQSATTTTCAAHNGGCNCKKRLQPCFFCFCFFPPTALFSARHKIRSPCAGTQGLSQCDWGIARGPSWQAENIAWLFLLLQPMNKTYAVLSLPCGHCWQVRLVWSLKKHVEDLKTVSVDAFVSTLKTHLL